ncbi:MAG: ABC transporter ATP-binding protein [Hydrogenophaga sp.]
MLSHPEHDSASDAILRICGLSKTYPGGFQALRNINLDIRRGEIFALLGPNGAGKTTLIGTVCGLTMPTEGRITADGHDVVRDYRPARALIGLVPQELHTDSFETVWDTVSFSRGLFGKAPDPALIERILKDLSLWDKKDNKIMTLSGGMKRRVLIAKALSHEPSILFLDEPSAGVDVALRHDMWRLVRQLREAGTTIILTTHYIEEAEDMADRIGVIRQGELIVVEDKAVLMRRLGRKELALTLQQPMDGLPAALGRWPLALSVDGLTLTYTFDTGQEDTGIADLLSALVANGIHFKDLRSSESSLEDIFVSLVHDTKVQA